MYLDDPREQQIDINNHTVWEEDNRIETRYQWGACVWDLCNMDPKDYGTTIFYTKPAGEELIKNTITANIKEGNVTLTFPYSPITNIYIVAKDSSGNKETIILPAGSTSPYYATFSIVTGPKISSLCIGPTEESAVSPTFSDGTYEYSIIKRVQTDVMCKFAVIEDYKVKAGLTPSVLKPYLKEAALSGDDTTIFTYVINPSRVDYYCTMGDTRAAAERQSLAVDLLFLTTTSASKIYAISDYDQTTSWTLNYTTMEIDGVTYSISRFKDSVANIYDPRSGQGGSDIPLTYKININKY